MSECKMCSHEHNGADGRCIALVPNEKLDGGFICDCPRPNLPISSFILDQDSQIVSLKEKVKELGEHELIMAVEKDARIKELEATADTYSKEWDASRKQVLAFAEKVELLQVRVIGQDEEIRQLEAQIAILQVGLEASENCIANARWCPVCENYRDSGHKSTCKVRQALSLSSPSEFLEAVRDVKRLLFEIQTMTVIGSVINAKATEALSKLRRFV